MNLASGVVKRRSQYSACTNPSPAAGPLIAAIRGLRKASGRWRGWDRSWEMVSGSTRPSWDSSSMSAPAQNPRPAPVTTTTRTPGSASAASSSAK